MHGLLCIGVEGSKLNVCANKRVAFRMLSTPHQTPLLNTVRPSWFLIAKTLHLISDSVSKFWPRCGSPTARKRNLRYALSWLLRHRLILTKFRLGSKRRKMAKDSVGRSTISTTKSLIFLASAFTDEYQDKYTHSGKTTTGQCYAECVDGTVRWSSYHNLEGSLTWSLPQEFRIMIQRKSTNGPSTDFASNLWVNGTHMAYRLWY